MTTQKFISTIEECYGRYPVALKPVIEQWLSCYEDDYKQELLAVLFETHSMQYKTPPGIPEFKAASDDVEYRLEQLSKKKATEKYLQERKRLLAEPEIKLVNFNGEMMTPLQAFMALTASKLISGVNPLHDSEVKAFMEKYGEKS